ncbi:Peptide transporter family 1 [Papilio machaon]|uniref:Peptide transporter family 1 n=1 Tax=Papilio machaon TaxID=76193 RepID=A0A194QVB4_PAPMA|nr:Peptide transporter family 1 [Papilio machaon]
MCDRMSEMENNRKQYNKSNDHFPKIILLILAAEFCERMSYSGMRVFLTLYLRNKLDYTDDEAKEIYHMFNGMVSLCPIFGGIVADNYLGKYRTILYMMFIYVMGNSLVAVTAIPQLMFPGRPCVTAFGGEQFALPEQERLLTLYFSILYFNLCVGSLIAKTLAPIFRGDVHCFGDKDCYPLAFGAPVIVIIISIVLFVSGRRRYIIKEPKGNIVVDFTKCIFGSSWALQASRMDGRLGSYTIKPDQLIVLSPISVMSFIALTQKYLYPCLAKWNLLTNPLNKLKVGGIMAALAFVATASVMYAVTGSELAFREAPENMKAVVGSIWILMQAFGNILIIIFTRLLVNVQMQTQFIMYASLMFLSMVIFHYQSRNYKFAENVKDEELQEMKGHSKYNTKKLKYKSNDSNSEEISFELIKD